MDFSRIVSEERKMPPVEEAPAVAAPAAVEAPGERPLPEPADEETRRANAFYRDLIRELRSLARKIDPTAGALSDQDVAPFSRLAEELILLLRDCPDAVLFATARSTPEDYLIGKQANLGVLAGRLALQLDEKPEELARHIQTGWLLHAGMHKCPRPDLNAALLTDNEKSLLLKNAADAAAALLRNCAIVDWAVRYWERKPEQQLKDAEAPLFATILKAAEIYEALCHARPHRPRIPAHDSVRYVINEGSEERLSQPVIKAVIQSLSVYPPGSYVELNNGIVAAVRTVNPKLPTRPVILPMFDKSGAPHPEAALLDLGKNPMLRIQTATDELELDFPNPKIRLQLRARLWWPLG